MNDVTKCRNRDLADKLFDKDVPRNYKKKHSPNELFVTEIESTNQHTHTLSLNSITMSERDIALYSAASHNDEEKGEAQFIMYSEDFLPSTSSSRSLTESRRNSIKSNDGILLKRSLRRRRESMTGKSLSASILQIN